MRALCCSHWVGLDVTLVPAELSQFLQRHTESSSVGTGVHNSGNMGDKLIILLAEIVFNWKQAAALQNNYNISFTCAENKLSLPPRNGLSMCLDMQDF